VVIEPYAVRDLHFLFILSARALRVSPLSRGLLRKARKGVNRHVSVNGNGTPHFDGALCLEGARYVQLAEDLDLVPEELY
jgi:hypothetical protein